jgi:hypothetical protein
MTKSARGKTIVHTTRSLLAVDRTPGLPFDAKTGRFLPGPRARKAVVVVETRQQRRHEDRMAAKKAGKIVAVLARQGGAL